MSALTCRVVRLAASFLLVLLLSALATPSRADSLDDLLRSEGLTRADLGWSPRGWWSRYPADIPHKLRHFDAVMNEPLAIVTFARTAGSAARVHLGAEDLERVPEKSDGALYKAAHALGVERRFGGFRSYSANLTAEPTDLVAAILALHEDAGRPVRFHTFGQDSPYPDYAAELEAMAAPLDTATRESLGRLILNLLDAHRWTERAFRNVAPEDRLAVQTRYDLGAELTDALDYFEELDDAAARVDEASLWYGALKAVAALDLARHELAGIQSGRNSAPRVTLDWPTPYGWIRIRGRGPDEIRASGSFLAVDLAGDDRWIGGAGTEPGTSVSVTLDMSGNDRYVSAHEPAQGAGLAGVGVLLDVRGNDAYQAEQCSQGFGQLGLGLLADLSGRDRYDVRYSGQGSGLLGVGLLLEGSGDDSYRVQSDGQGFGGAGGVGTLADRSGDDRYEAVRDPEVTGRPSYHSEGKVAVSNSQGVGMGRRGDGSDGHSWGGGLGQLIDVEGDDEYVSGNWAMGTGYWFGTGLLWDGAGDDRYDGVIWTQASGAHFCIGALIDEAGDDEHLVHPEGRSSLSFGHDFAVTVLADISGDDRYERAGDGLGFSINRSFSLVLEGGGDDVYRGPENAVPGTARYDKRFSDRTGSYTYFADASSLGLFLDIGGEDDYGTLALTNGDVHRDPPGAPNREARNFSLAADVSEGTLDLRARPEKPPSGR